MSVWVVEVVDILTGEVRYKSTHARMKDAYMEVFAVEQQGAGMDLPTFLQVYPEGLANSWYMRYFAPKWVVFDAPSLLPKTPQDYSSQLFDMALDIGYYQAAWGWDHEIEYLNTNEFAVYLPPFGIANRIIFRDLDDFLGLMADKPPKPSGVIYADKTGTVRPSHTHLEVF